MDPRKLPFNALIVGPTNSGKTQYLLNQLRGPFKGKFDYIVLLCPTFVKNKTYKGFVVDFMGELEAEPAPDSLGLASSHRATTFPPNARSLPSSIRLARPKRSSAFSSHTTRSNACRIRRWRTTTNDRKLISEAKPPSR